MRSPFVLLTITRRRARNLGGGALAKKMPKDLQPKSEKETQAILMRRAKERIFLTMGGTLPEDLAFALKNGGLGVGNTDCVPSQGKKLR